MIKHKKNLFFVMLVLGFHILNAQSLEWVRPFGGISTDGGLNIITDTSGNIYTVGYFSESVDFDHGPENFNLTSTGSTDNFVQKMDPNGNLIWAKSFGGSEYDRINSIEVDPSGNLYTTGFFYGTVDFDPGSGISNLTSTSGGDIFIQKLDTNGELLWAKSIVGQGNNDYGKSIVTDASGNIYINGTFEYMADFDPGVATHYLTASGNEGMECFILKLNSNGDFIWVKSFGGYSFSLGDSLAVDGLGNVYNTAHFYGTVDFDPGAGINNLTSEGYTDIFIQKLDTYGNFVWAKSFGGYYFDDGYSISLDNFGNVYTSGIFFGTVDFDPGSGMYDLTSNGERDVFVLKLNSDGNFLWAKSFGGTSGDSGFSTTVDLSGNVYTTGSFYYTVDFDPGNGVTNLTSASTENPDAFIQKLDSNGNFLWASSFNGTSSGLSVALDSSGNAYTTGGFTGTVDFNSQTGNSNFTSAGDDDIFISKMNGTTLGINDDVSSINIKVYPNPSNDIVQIDAEKEIYNVEVILTDIRGRFIFKKLYNSFSNLIVELPAEQGVYILTIRADDSNRTVKLIKS